MPQRVGRFKNCMCYTEGTIHYRSGTPPSWVSISSNSCIKARRASVSSHPKPARVDPCSAHGFRVRFTRLPVVIRGLPPMMSLGYQRTTGTTLAAPRGILIGTARTRVVLPGVDPVAEDSAYPREGPIGLFRRLPHAREISCRHGDRKSCRETRLQRLGSQSSTWSEIVPWFTLRAQAGLENHRVDSYRSSDMPFWSLVGGSAGRAVVATGLAGELRDDAHLDASHLSEFLSDYM